MEPLELVKATTSVVDVFLKLKNLIPHTKDTSERSELGKRTAEFRSGLATWQQKIELLASMLVDSESLTRQIPFWISQANQIPTYQGADSLDGPELQRVHVALRSIVHMSISDTFSGLFFHSEFKSIPGMATHLDAFRNRVKELDKNLQVVQPNDVVMFKALWPRLRVLFESLQTEAYLMGREAEDTRGALVRELQQTAKLLGQELAKA